MEHADYEYNTRYDLQRSRDYWLKMIKGWKFDSCSEQINCFNTTLKII